MDEPVPILVLEDDPILSRCIERVASRYGHVWAAPGMRAAVSLLHARRAWGAFILDVALPDGNGLDFLALARDEHPAVPALILSAFVDGRVANAGYDLNARVVAKPWAARRLATFLGALSDPTCAVGEDGVEAFAAHHGLPPSEADILARLAAGAEVGEIARARGTSELTVRKQIASLRLRTGDESTRALVIRALTEGRRT